MKNWLKTDFKGQMLSFLIIALFPFWILCAEPLKVDVKAESAILINGETGAILYEKNAHTLRYPASSTKIATAIYALHLVGDKLETVVVADHDAVGSVTEEEKQRSNYKLPSHWLVRGACHMGIKKGEELTLKDLLFGMMVSSADDASNVIAQHIGGTVPNYMTGLNAYLKTIGCQQTYFNNPHGLYHPKHQTTAYDLAIMLKEGLKYPIFRELISCTRYTRPKTNKQESSIMVQTNRLIRKGKYYYSKAIGGKTGYVSKASHVLVCAAEHEGRLLITAVVKSKERNDVFTDTVKLFEAAFNQSKVQRILLKKGSQTFTMNLKGAAKPVLAYIKQDASIEYYPAEEPKVKCMLKWTIKVPPIVKDQQIGELSIQVDDKLVQTIPVFAQEDVQGTWFWWLRHLF